METFFSFWKEVILPCSSILIMNEGRLSDLKSREHCIFCAHCDIKERFVENTGKKSSLMLKVTVFG